MGGQVVGAAFGDRSYESLRALWQGVPKGYRRKLVYTDGYSVYEAFFAAWQHTVCAKGDGRTSRVVEGINTFFRSRVSSLRQRRVSGLVRKELRVCATVKARVTDVWERFLLVCHWHNQRCRKCGGKTTGINALKAITV